MALYSSYKPVFGAVSTLIAGTDTAVSTSSGIVTVWNTSTLQSVTDRGFTTTNRVNITDLTSSTDYLTGALTVAGGVGIGGDLWINGSLTVASIEGTATSAENISGGNTGDIPIQSATGVTSFIPAGLTNQLLQSQGSTATFVNTSTVHVGYASSVAGGAAGRLVYQVSESTTGFLSPGSSGQLLMSTGSTPVYQNTLTVSGSSVLVSSIESSISTASGALQVAGGVGVGGDLHIGGTFTGVTQSYIKSSSLDPLNSSTFTLESTVPVGYSSFTIKNSGTSGKSYTFDVGGNNRALTGGASVNEGNLTIHDDTSNEYRLVITKTGNMLVNTATDTGATLQVNGSIAMTASIQENTVILVNTTSTTEVDSFDSALYRSSKSLIQIQDGDDFHITEIVLLHDNSGQVYKSEYGIISTGGERGIFTADLQLDGIVRLYFTAETASDKKISIVKTAIAL
jgi:hypothetical protein